jgi:hypothetical protein
MDKILLYTELHKHSQRSDYWAVYTGNVSVITGAVSGLFKERLRKRRNNSNSNSTFILDIVLYKDKNKKCNYNSFVKHFHARKIH